MVFDRPVIGFSTVIRTLFERVFFLYFSEKCFVCVLALLAEWYWVPYDNLECLPSSSFSSEVIVKCAIFSIIGIEFRRAVAIIKFNFSAGVI